MMLQNSQPPISRAHSVAIGLTFSTTTPHYKLLQEDIHMKQPQTLTTTNPRPTVTTDAVVAPTPADESPVVPAVAHPESKSGHDSIATEAYFLAERRGFAPGSELDDWLAAEAAVKARGRAAQAGG